MNLQELKYSEEHEWVHLDSNGLAMVGITKFAADNLGDVVFVELPENGSSLSQFEKMGEIESVKAVSDLYTPVGGTVSETNDQLLSNPELVNEDPYESGWMVKITLADLEELGNLMDSNQYNTFLSAQE